METYHVNTGRVPLAAPGCALSVTPVTVHCSSRDRWRFHRGHRQGPNPTRHQRASHGNEPSVSAVNGLDFCLLASTGLSTGSQDGRVPDSLRHSSHFL